VVQCSLPILLRFLIPFPTLPGVMTRAGGNKRVCRSGEIEEGRKMSRTDFSRATRRITEGEIEGEMGAACGRFLTADVDVHGSTAAAIKGADALAVITVPCADPATTAGGEEEVSVPVVLDAGQGTVVALEKDGPHSWR